MKFSTKILPFFIFCSIVYSQVGINTNDPKGVFHIDAKGNNKINPPNPPNQTDDTDDLIFTIDGNLGIGTITPQNKLQIIGDGVNHPVNVQNIQPLTTQSDLLYIDSEGNVGTSTTNQLNGNQIFVVNAKVPTRGTQNAETSNGYNTSTGIDLSLVDARNYMPWKPLAFDIVDNQTVKVVSNTLNAEIDNVNYIKISRSGYYSIQVQGAFSCYKENTSTPLSYYALDMIMYKGVVANTSSASEIERKRIVVGRNDGTSYAGSFYTVVGLNENDYISFAIAPGLKDDGVSPIVSTSKLVYHCGIGTPSGNASNFSSISLILL